ncbi:hypothetical protein LTR50_007579 [Elasticomyces elasticus]|nr:hypothetical protein LTR50_007579 [Elasticomyces elasticus]
MDIKWWLRLLSDTPLHHDAPPLRSSGVSTYGHSLLAIRYPIRKLRCSSSTHTDQPPQDTKLSLISIPLDLYNHFVRPILKILIFPETTGDKGRESRRLWEYPHPFVNVSLTPIECSIVCTRRQAADFFIPILGGLSKEARSRVSITPDDYVVIQVDGQGLDAGYRVLDLTSPLALAGISIFFITTYTSDYILVPLRARSIVISALEARGFEFRLQESDHTTSTSNHISPLRAHHRNHSSTSSFEALSPSPGTPPPSTNAELEIRTFNLLKQRGVEPLVDPDIRLLGYQGPKDNSEATQARIQLGLTRAFLSQPRFISLTLTDTEPLSVYLEPSVLERFFDGVLYGNTADVLVPITLDLRDLPMESTGIVCGIAGRLVSGISRGGIGEDAIEMMYLSTARAGSVIVCENELERAMGSLRAVKVEVEENGDTMEERIQGLDIN